jgi:hypothetical protein
MRADSHQQHAAIQWITGYGRMEYGLVLDCCCDMGQPMARDDQWLFDRGILGMVVQN